jgi:hypothetical protein
MLPFALNKYLIRTHTRCKDAGSEPSALLVVIGSGIETGYIDYKYWAYRGTASIAQVLARVLYGIFSRDRFIGQTDRPLTRAASLEQH